MILSVTLGAADAKRLEKAAKNAGKSADEFACILLEAEVSKPFDGRNFFVPEVSKPHMEAK